MCVCVIVIVCVCVCVGVCVCLCVCVIVHVCNCKEYNLTNISQGNDVFHMLNMGALRILNKKQE